jgi:hypothetical protein
MNTHTPGPWAQAQYSPADVVAGEKIMVASARYGLNDVSREQAIANARLIAAAPELLAAVRGLLICVWPRGDAETLDAYETRTAMLKDQIARADAAIAKATT